MTTETEFDPQKRLEHFRLLTPTLRFTDLIIATRPRASVLNARLVYSWLAYRSRLDLPASIRSINRDVGLHAATIGQALADLGPLVTHVGTDWHAVEPPPGLFHERSGKHGQHWSDQFAYSVIFLPRKGANVTYPETRVRFGLNHAIVWSHIVRSRNEHGKVTRFTIGGTAALYGLADNTVRSVLNDLVWLKLVTRIDKGGFSELTVHVPTGQSLDLFRLKTDTPPATSQEAKERAPRPYVQRNAGWDRCRQLCHGLMPQKLADDIVAMAIVLEETPHDFKNEFARIRNLYETNKHGEGKFGGYLRAAYLNRVNERQSLADRQAEEDRIATKMANIDWHALEEARLKAAAHDPLHKDFRYDDHAVFARVDLGPRTLKTLQRLTAIEEATCRPIQDHVRLHYRHLDTQAEVDLKASLRRKVRCQALAEVNHYYKQDIKATEEEFKQAIDRALEVFGMDPVFRPKKETAKCLT